MNILGTDQENGHASVPSSVQKIICTIALFEWKRILSELQKEFDEL